MPLTPVDAAADSAAPWASFARAAAGAPVGLLVADQSGTVVASNAEAKSFLKIPAHDAVAGRPINALFDSGDAVVRGILVDCLRDGTAYRGQLAIKAANGASVDCDFATYRIDSESGAFCVVWMNDISEHAAMQRSLVQAERLSALGEIVAGVAHELNNPLTGILGYGQLLLKDVEDDKTRLRLDRIVAEAMRCQAIVQSLRGFSSHGGSSKGVHEINQVVDSMVALLEYQMRVDGIEVCRAYSPSMPQLLLNAPELSRAILNIAHNAHQALLAVPSGSRTFTVTSEVNENEVLIRFQDSGPGIAAENLPRIFDPFFTTREFGAGVGLGLSVAYGVVREHGGRIDVHSEPGNGAEFIICLPRKAVF